jgi:hypothetical protein
LEEFALVVRLEISGGCSYHPDLSVGRVWAHLEPSYSWAELLRVSVFHLERGIFHLEELASRSTCIGLHLSSSLWGHILYWREHFVAAHTYYLSVHLRIIPDRLSIVLVPCVS